MLLYVTFSALLNLGIGYALGAGLTFSELLERLPLRHRQPVDDLQEEDTLTRPPKAQAPVAKAEKIVEPIEEEAEPAAPSEEAPAAEAPAEETPASDPPKKPLDVMAGLADFREQLATAGLELKLNAEDPDKFTDCAQSVQKASQGYIEKAIETATSLADQGDAASVAASEVIASGVEKATAISEKFDEQLEGELTDKKRADLVNQAAAMKDAAAETQLQAEEQLTTEVPEDQKTEEIGKGEDSIRAPIASETIFDQIEKALELAEDDKALLVASLSADPIEGHEDDTELLTAITQSLDEMIAQSLEETQAYSSAAEDPAKRPLLLLGGDTFGAASRRIESLRQMVEATTFQRGDETFRATVTCALAECRKENDRKAIEAQLTQALDESERLGHNKTYHHDGAFPTPLPELSVDAIERTVPI